MKVYRKSFRPKLSFVKSIPDRLLEEGGERQVDVLLGLVKVTLGRQLGQRMDDRLV
jgi:hypothetical protein